MAAGIRLTGLWVKQGQQGEQYFEGTLGNASIRIYQNKYKQRDNQPDYLIYLNEKPRDNQRQAPRAQAQGPIGRPPAGAVNQMRKVVESRQAAPSNPNYAPQHNQAFKPRQSDPGYTAPSQDEPPEDLWERGHNDENEDIPF